MMPIDPLQLRDDERMRVLCRDLQVPENWVHELSGTIRFVRSASEAERRTREFQYRLWEDNHVSNVGQGAISVAPALDDPAFRQWLAARSIASLPVGDARAPFLADFYSELKAKIRERLAGRMPRLKIFRVLAALYPEAMTTISDRRKTLLLAQAMGGSRTLGSVERHLWIRDRVDRVLGTVDAADTEALGRRMALPWMLYERLTASGEATSSVAARGELASPDERVSPSLQPLPGASRRRGLTAIKGLFQTVLSALEFVGDGEGVTRQELLDHFAAESPESKPETLKVTVGVLRGELDLIRRERETYVLTERGRRVRESQEADPLADWLVTHILGVDKAILELRDHSPMRAPELTAAIRAMHPGWKTDFVPQAIAGWLRSFGVVETTPDWKWRITERGRRWAELIYWTPEALPTTEEPAPTADVPLALPAAAALVETVRRAGHFSGELIATLHAALWSHKRRHFAILTGLSGSGKTLLAREYAKALTAESSPDGRLLTVPVQPGWYDPAALLGYINPLRNDAYVRQPFLDFVLRAASDPTRPYVVVLDEMNLSHPEQYMAPLLSAMETGEPLQLHSGEEALDGIPALMPYPHNFALIGTVNMDETTHGLSDKVLDRAFVIEFWDVDLAAYPRWSRREVPPTEASRVRAVLAGLMTALAPARLHFGWRVVDSVLDYLGAISEAGDVISFDAALDGAVYAKVLPKLRGEDSPRFRDALEGCETTLKEFGLTRSLAKVAELRRDVDATGSARFWR